jgi:hypothetical protein
VPGYGLPCIPDESGIQSPGKKNVIEGDDRSLQRRAVRQMQKN